MSLGNLFYKKILILPSIGYQVQEQRQFCLIYLQTCTFFFQHCNIFTSTKSDSLYFLRKLIAIHSFIKTDSTFIYTPRFSTGRNIWSAT